MADDQKSRLNVEVLRKATSRLHIRDISLRTCKAELADEYIPKLESQDFDVQLRWGPRNAKEMVWTNNETKEDDRVFLVLINTAVRFVDKDSESRAEPEIKPKAVFEADFLAEYKIDGEEPVPGEALDEFARHNVIYHVWPYWRELVQTLCARTNLPHFTLPMFVYGPKSSAKRSENKSAAVAAKT